MDGRRHLQSNTAQRSIVQYSAVLESTDVSRLRGRDDGRRVRTWVLGWMLFSVELSSLARAGGGGG